MTRSGSPARTPPTAPRRWLSVLGLPPLLSLARERALDPAALLRAARIPAALLDDPLARVAPAREHALVAALLEATADPALGLAAGRRYHLSAFGLLGSVVQAAPGAHDAIRLFLEHLDLTYTPFAVSYRERRGEHALCFVDHEDLGPLRRFYLDRDLTFVLETAATLWPAEHRRMARRVDLDYPEPPEAARYRQAAPCPVRFGADVAAVVIDPAAAGPRAGTSGLALRLLEDHLGAFAAGNDARERVRRAIATAVATRCTLPDEAAIAGELGMTDRTLRRQLASTGISFRAVADDVLASLARRHLRDGDLPVAAVAMRLGYGEAAAFVRAFRRWTGTTPAAFRTAARRA